MLCEREGWLQAGAGDCSAGPAPSCCPPEPSTCCPLQGALWPAVLRAVPPKAGAGACFCSPRRQPPLPQPLSKTGGWLCSEDTGGAVAPAGVAPRSQLGPGRSRVAGHHCHQPADSGVWPPGWPRSAPAGQGELRATAGCRGECSQRCRAGSCGHAPSASWVSPAGPARLPGLAPKPSFWTRLQRRHTGHGLWGARLTSHQEGSCGCSAWPGLVRACSTSPPAAQAGKAAALGWGHIVAWPCLTRAPGQCARDTDLRPEVTGAAVPCSAWVRLCAPHPGPGDTQQGLGPRLLAAGLAGREYTSWLGSGEGGQDVRTACGEAGAVPGASGSLGAALALQALGL